MTYQEIIQSVGKQINKKVYYYNSSNTRVNVDTNNIEEAKLSFKSNIVGTIMKELTLTLKEEINTSNAIYLEVEATYGNNTSTKTYGPYYLKECEFDANSKNYIHTCYDSILKTMVEYEPINITYPTTLQSYYNKLIETLGLTSSVSLINGSKQLSSDIFKDINYTYRTVLQEIAEANGILLYVDGTTVKEASFGNSENQATITDDILKNTNIGFGEHYGPINVISLSRSGDSDIVYYPTTLPNDKCEFKIKDNQLLNDNNRSDYLIGIYTKLSGKEYDIFDTELVGYGGFEPLQKVVFETGDSTYESYVFNNEITITAGYTETIYTDLPEESTTNYEAADTTDKKINQAYIIVDKQNQQIDAVVSQVDEQDEKIASISLTVDELNSKISDVANITVEKQSEYGSVQLDNVNASEPIYIRVYPINNNISYSYPNNGSFPTDDYDGIRILRFTNTKTNEIIYDYEIPNDLLYYDEETYDDFILDYEKETCTINQRCDYNANGEVVKKTSTTTLTYPYPTIELTDGNYKVELLTYNSGYLNVRLMATNIYTTQFYTKVETDSKIRQSKNEIELGVSETYTNKRETEELSSQVIINKNNITSEISRAKTEEGKLDDKFNSYSTTTEMTNTINQKLTDLDNEISLEVSKKVDTTTYNTGMNSKVNNSDYTHAKIVAKINDNTSSAIIEADKISLAGKTINMTSDNIAIDSNNFKVSKEGNITATGGTIGGFTLGANTFTASSTLNYRYTNDDIQRVLKIYLGAITPTQTDYDKYDINGDGVIDLMDSVIISSLVNGSRSYSSKFKIDTTSPDTSIQIKNDNGEECVKLGTYGTYINTLMFDNIETKSQNISLKKSNGEIQCVSLTQTSKEEAKKNFEKFDNALDIIKDIDIYKYNYKLENDDDKKHIGFVIGDKYNYSQDITSQNNDGVDIYSFVSLCCKAIQEQQEQINELKNEIQKIKESR